MNEIAIIDRLRRRFGYRGRGLVLGIGDDCAIFRPSGSREDLVFTSDQLIEGVHFLRGTPARKVGERALGRALSDIAAMGADPRFCLVSLAMPASFRVEDFFEGIRRVARPFRMSIAGGDLARSRHLSCDIAICGSLPRGTALRRDRAVAGQALFVSGPLGRSAARNYRDVPQPRIAEGRRLRGRATACLDVSDGLSMDLYRLCVASQVSASLTMVPVADGATVEQALRGGEDYELVYTGENLPGICIGTIGAGPAGTMTLDGAPLLPAGWDHFPSGTRR